MRWKIKSFEFCEQQQTLINQQYKVRMEPMISDLLGYFCRHQNQIISKEQLLDDVWHGRYVSDNTVSKLITKLRKVLQDDARNPIFIVTVPKRGYRFVAEAEQVKETKVSVADKKVSSPKQSRHQPYLFFIPFCVIVFLVWFALQNKTVPSAIVSAKAVTSNKGSEYFPSFAADGVRLSYMNHDGEKFRLYVKNIYSGEQIEIDHGKDMGVGPGSWNKAGTKLVYLVGSQNSCQYFIREFNGLEMSAPSLIYTCNAGSVGAIKFTHDDNLLIFSEAPEQGKAYSLYSLELDSGKTQWLPQPDIYLGGNSQFDLHPTENKLLISSPDKQQWEGFYQLNLETRQLSLLFKLNAYICCGIWSHDGEHVVLMGEHPARDIVQYTLDGSDSRVVFTGSQNLHRPERHSNGHDYVFTAFKNDLDVEEYNMTNNTSKSILNDTFDERLAVLSPNTERIAYISLTSGNEELWLFDRNTSKKKKITQFKDGRHYVDLTWSPDQLKVAALTLNSIHLIDLKSGEARLLQLPEKEFRGISFKSPNVVAFSMKLDSSWQVVEYNIDDNAMTRLNPKWQSVQYDVVSDDWLWVDQDGHWYQGENANHLNMPKQHLPVFYGRQFNVKKSGEYIALYNWQLGKVEIYKNQTTKPLITLDSQIGHFSMKGNIVLTSQRSSKVNDSDIYQTYSVPLH
ncbi:winged helix-turn-helix domain-containing protein [Psychrosphaera aestuarii]|uniref:winged helix-turn-helix domain-containing protein n=1 Tax=Psychrosphaera aestuarii TaxID=1266052 RepID=UPI001B32BF49|nr:winged helix-turn-helix domain-containing protein [Psychrosphaera aestuarii]